MFSQKLGDIHIVLRDGQTQFLTVPHRSGFVIILALTFKYLTRVYFFSLILSNVFLLTNLLSRFMPQADFL